MRRADEKRLNTNEMGDIVICQAEDGNTKIDVRFENENIWLTHVFGRDKSTVSRHLKNIFVEEGLERDSVATKIAPTAADGKIYMVNHYNLVAVISLAV